MTLPTRLERALLKIYLKAGLSAEEVPIEAFDILKLLRGEQAYLLAQVVRMVKELKQVRRKITQTYPITKAFTEAYTHACDDLLAALRKGRI